MAVKQLSTTPAVVRTVLDTNCRCLLDLSDLNVIVIRCTMFASVIGCGNAHEERGTVALRSLGVIADAELRRPNGVNRLQ